MFDLQFSCRLHSAYREVTLQSDIEDVLRPREQTPSFERDPHRPHGFVRKTVKPFEQRNASGADLEE